MAAGEKKPRGWGKKGIIFWQKSLKAKGGSSTPAPPESAPVSATYIPNAVKDRQGNVWTFCNQGEEESGGSLISGRSNAGGPGAIALLVGHRNS